MKSEIQKKSHLWPKNWPPIYYSLILFSGIWPRSSPVLSLGSAGMFRRYASLLVFPIHPCLHARLPQIFTPLQIFVWTRSGWMPSYYEGIWFWGKLKKNKYLKIPHWGHSWCVGVIRFLSGPKKWIATFSPRRSPATISTGANWNRRKIRGQKRPSHKCAKTANAARSS